MTVFWNVAVALMLQEASISETWANFYQATWRNIPEYIYLHTHRRENLKRFLERFYVIKDLLIFWLLNIGSADNGSEGRPTSSDQ
jgi:hypothetical protein